MKTLTEFNGSHFNNLEKQRAELVAAGKTPEELTAALGEVLKLEGDRLKAILAAEELVKGKIAGLKRIVVIQLAEGEKAAGGLVERDGLYFAVEHFPSGIQKPKAPEDRDPRGGRGKKGGKKGGDRGGRDNNRGGGGRGGDGARDSKPATVNAGGKPALPKPNAGAGAKSVKPVVAPKAAPLNTSDATQKSDQQ